MREIKFRAWDRVSKRFTFIGFSVHAEGDINCHGPWHKPEDLSVNQFSGLQDINGVDIYEGDIVYLAGFGDYEVEFPFVELYEAGAEKDIGEIKGHVFSKGDNNVNG